MSLVAAVFVLFGLCLMLSVSDLLMHARLRKMEADVKELQAESRQQLMNQQAITQAKPKTRTMWD